MFPWTNLAFFFALAIPAAISYTMLLWGFFRGILFKNFVSYCFSNSCSDALRNSCRDRFRKPSKTLSGTTPAIPSRITPEISSGIFQGFHFKFRSSFASYYEKLGLSPFNKFITFLYISITHGFSSVINNHNLSSFVS